MTAAATYQVAFKFQFQQGFSGKQIQLAIADTNNFVIDNGKQAQLEPYMGSDTPPLLNFSLSNQQLFLNIGSGLQGDGVEGVLWSTFTSSGNGQTLNVELTAPTGLINAYYTVMGTSTSGQLSAGKNTITVNA